MKVRFLRASYFVWVFAWMGLVAVYQLIGLPHLLTGYELPGRCSYIGMSGALNIYFPHNGRCPWILFRKSNARAAQ